MIRPLGVPTDEVVCPVCHGEASRYLSGPSWGYWGGSDTEYAECPECEGHGTVDRTDLPDIARRRRTDWDGDLLTITED